MQSSKKLQVFLYHHRNFELKRRYFPIPDEDFALTMNAEFLHDKYLPSEDC